MRFKFDFKELLKRRVEYNEYNVFSLALLGSLGHPIFWTFWTYIDPQLYESFYLRLMGVISCLILFTIPNWNSFFRKYSSLYWIMSITYNLPFFFTVNLINNHFSYIGVSCEIVIMMVVFFAIENIIASIIILMIGISLAGLFCTVMYPENMLYNADLIAVIPVVFFAIVTAIIFSYSNLKGMSIRKDIKHQNKIKIIKSLAGSIAHEIRNPLNSIRLSASSLIDQMALKTISELSSLQKEDIIHMLHNEQIEITKHKDILDQTIKLANEVIDMTLLDLSGKSISKEDHIFLNSSTAITDAMNIYGYQNNEEKSKVVFKDLDKEFIFSAVSTPFKYILSNLVKNSLFYLTDFPDSVVTIGSQINKTFELDGIKQKFNTIYIHDTGPGIPKKALKEIFGSFYTSGKKGGTGLGLDFCKRTMISFGGDIICESEYGDGESGWTRFSLLFPIVSNVDSLDKNLLNSNGPKSEILIVDDQITNLTITKRRIEKHLPNVHCSTAIDGEESIKLIKENNYKLILMDIQMPRMDGIKAVKRIREFNKDIPIIAFTSLNHREFVKEAKINLKGKSISENFDFYLNKSSPSNILYRSISKLLMDRDDSLTYLGDKEEYLKALNKKKIILADDQEINLMMTKKRLEKYGVEVITVNNGKDLVEKYRENIIESGHSNYDMIITDINMPPFNGDEATQEIRKIEKEHGIFHRNKIPIIALSGDGNKEDIHHFLECRMTDYFIKGEDPEILTKIVANYLISVKDHEYGSDFNRNVELEIETDKIALNSSSKETDSKIFNTEIFEDVSSKEDLINTLTREVNESLKKAQSSYEDKDIENLYIHIHALKGIFGNIGAEEIFNMCDAINIELNNNKLPTDQNLKSLDSQCKHLIKELIKYV